MQQPTKKRIRYVVKKSEPMPPLFVPNPESIQSVPRCVRDSCRCIVPTGREKCPSCGCRIISTEPLSKLTIFIEEC